MIYLDIEEVLRLQEKLIDRSGGSHGILNRGAVESALAQPRMSFSGEELYPTLVEKAAALGFSLIQNHAFIDGNKRIGQAAMELFLLMNGFEIQATVDEQEQVILQVASGAMKREVLAAWLVDHLIPFNSDRLQ